ncbi:MAG: [protein-PII] uridylyltransferase [Sphingomonas taxi]|uniref:Bifunctional uridylyltransferase/uridylyl-removing enzyme n=1 Tax=Sphingomonas taxi TaxID=1549858 RepID=A0A2W5PCX9_9SPHN|nr:MAG: [protein-PII] uridylyltransferase [Sphingomonas taxi]
MTARFDHLPHRRAIVDRRLLAEQVAAVDGTDMAATRHQVSLLLKAALDAGRAEIARRLTASPSRGIEAANAQAYLIDQLLIVLADFTTQRLYPLGNPTQGERLLLIAVGGYGRGEMAPFSDVDIGFLTPGKQTPWAEQAIESMLYTLWDLGLKIGHSSRSLDEMVRQARGDMTVRTALLEGRYVWGDEDLYQQASQRFRDDVRRGTERQFAADKLAERNARHVRMGDTRYVVEPNVKEGKGGLRDLHALFWIGKYTYDVQRSSELFDAGLFTRAEYRLFHRADNFLWAVRCHLHLIAGRAEDRLTFDYQREIAQRMNYADRPGKPAVERFMQFYFLQAKTVGSLTGLFLAHMDERFSRRRRLGLTVARTPRKLDGFAVDRGRIALPSDDFFQADPRRLVEIFALAAEQGMEIHPLALRCATRDAKLAAAVRRDPWTNARFLDLLAGANDPELALRWMNETGVLGRFVPDWARIVAQMQFDMYHHYTVDEHTIRAIGLLSRLERGALAEEHPLPSEIVGQIVSRRVLYVAVLLHDIAKGRGGDHSILGAEVAERLCPRFGLTPAETETVAWLVRHHLLMSATAFRRDLTDFKTILDFTDVVQSPERLRLLLVLTVVDIRAVGPGTWNGWKGQLLGDLYDRAEEVLRLGHKQKGRGERVVAKQEGLRVAMGWDAATLADYVRRLPEPYWIAEPADVLAHNAAFVSGAGAVPLAIDAQVYPERGATLVTVYAADHPGLFSRIAGAIHVAGGNIIDARIHTTRDGMALDNFLVQDPLGRPFGEPGQLMRLKTAIEDALAGRGKLTDRLQAKPLPRARADAFRIEPGVLVDNKASNRFTVVEVAARDRPALLNQLAYALFLSKVTIHSAHVATYGERAVDVFYLTDLTGDKIIAPARVRGLEKRLLSAAAGVPHEEVA